MPFPLPQKVSSLACWEGPPGPSQNAAAIPSEFDFPPARQHRRQTMKRQEKEVTIFYCTHQRERVAEILKGLNGSGMLRWRQVALPCSGKLEVFQLTRALEKGADGVALFGCLEGACRYVVGSSRARGRVSQAGEILGAIGMEKDRVRRFALESPIQSQTREDFCAWAERIKALEPLHPGSHDLKAGQS